MAARLDSSSEDDDDDDFHKDKTWLGPEDVGLSSYVLQPVALPCLALPTAAFPASMSCVMTAE